MTLFGGIFWLVAPLPRLLGQEFLGGGSMPHSHNRNGTVYHEEQMSMCLLLLSIDFPRAGVGHCGKDGPIHLPKCLRSGARSYGCRTTDNACLRVRACGKHQEIHAPIHLPLAVAMHAMFSRAANIRLRNGLRVPAGLAAARFATEPCPNCGVQGAGSRVRSPKL